MEIWSLEVKVGSKWDSRKTAFTKEALLRQANIYVSRAVQTEYETRIVPYVIDETRAEKLG